MRGKPRFDTIQTTKEEVFVKNEFLEKQNVELRKALDLSARGEISQALELIDAYIDCHPGSAPAYRAKAMALSDSAAFILRPFALAARSTSSYVFVS